MSLEGEKKPEFVVSETVDSWNIPTKTFEYRLNGETTAVGTAKIISQPFPLVYVQGIDVSKEHMSEGYGSKLMDQMENLMYRKEHWECCIAKSWGPNRQKCMACMNGGDGM